VTRRDKPRPGRPRTSRSPARPAQPPRPQPETRPARPAPGAWQMNPDLWQRPDPTLTWPLAPGLRPRPGMPASSHQAGQKGDAGHPLSPMPVSFTFAFTAPQPDGAPTSAGQELGHALIRILDARLAHEKTRWETDFEGEPLL
jgi:hypothetical protein